MTPNAGLVKARAAKAAKYEQKQKDDARTMTAYKKWLSKERAAYQPVIIARNAGDSKAYAEALVGWRAVLAVCPRIPKVES